MSANYYEMCQGAIGRAVEIHHREGGIHRGVIERVEPEGVWLSPLPAGEGAGGPGVYAWGWGLGWWWIPFAAITALAFLPFFFW